MTHSFAGLFLATASSEARALAPFSGQGAMARALRRRDAFVDGLGRVDGASRG